MARTTDGVIAIDSWEALVRIVFEQAQRVAAQGKELARLSVLVDRLAADQGLPLNPKKETDK